MGIFGGFRAKFSKDSSQKKKDKSDINVVCTSYRVFSEFDIIQDIKPSHYSQSKPSTSGTLSQTNLANQNRPKPQNVSSKLPSTSASTQNSTKVEIITIREDNNISARKIKAKSHYELSSFKPKELANGRVHSAEDLSNLPLPSPPPRLEKKPTPKIRKSVENLVPNNEELSKDLGKNVNNNTNNISEYHSYQEPSEENVMHAKVSQNTTLKRETENYYIAPDDEKTNSRICSEPNDSEVTKPNEHQQNSEEIVVPSRFKQLKKENAQKRGKVLMASKHTEYKETSEHSITTVEKDEKVFVSTNANNFLNSQPVKSIEVSSNIVKTESASTNDYGTYFTQKATSFGYSTSQAASIFFQDDDHDDDNDEIINHKLKNETDDHKTSWKGVQITEISDDDESRRVSSVEC